MRAGRAWSSESPEWYQRQSDAVQPRGEQSRGECARSSSLPRVGAVPALALASHAPGLTQTAWHSVSTLSLTVPANERRSPVAPFPLPCSAISPCHSACITSPSHARWTACRARALDQSLDSTRCPILNPARPVADSLHSVSLVPSSTIHSRLCRPLDRPIPPSLSTSLPTLD